MCIIPFSHFIFHSQDLSSQNPLKAVSCQRQSDKLTWKKYSSTLYPSAFLSFVLFTSSSSCFPSYLLLLLWIHGGFKPPHPDVDSCRHICFVFFIAQIGFLLSQHFSSIYMWLTTSCCMFTFASERCLLWLALGDRNLMTFRTKVPDVFVSFR